MSLIIISDVTKHFGGQTVLSGVSFRVEQGARIGLVGPNGAGKTTLLNMVAGRLVPDAGNVAIARGTSIGYLVQIPQYAPDRSVHDELMSAFDTIRDLEHTMHAIAASLADPEILAQHEVYQQLLDQYANLQEQFENANGYTVEYRVQQILNGLGFTEEQHTMPAMKLSGGQQTRVELGKLLLMEPEILLLDEPTNHLDMAAIEWLEEFLATWKGALILVSHDRYFLDRIITRTIEVDNQHIEEYPGNYTTYIQLRDERKELQGKAFDKQQESIAKTEEFIRRYKAGQRSKEARGRQKLLDRLERVERPYHAVELHFQMRISYTSGEQVLKTSKLAIGFPQNEKPLFQVPDMIIERGSRVALIGLNGSGKTSLLRTIVGELQPLAGTTALGHNVKIGYYAQTHDFADSTRLILEEIREATPISEESARTFLGRFQFSGDDVYKPVGRLSGGERARVALARLTLQGANFLILDEPTNHLDLPARQFLEAVLDDYEGTILFISHDRYFIDALATHIWSVQDGTLSTTEGNYSIFRKKQAQLVIREQAATRITQQRERTRTREQREITEKSPLRTVSHVENEVTTTEQSIAELEDALTEASLAADVERITALALSYEDAQKRLAILMEEWESIAE